MTRTANTRRTARGQLARHLTYANVMSTICAVAVLTGGTAWAATTIHGKYLKPRSVTGAKIKINSITGAEVNEAKLGKVATAKKADVATQATTATSAASATTATSATTAASASTAADAAALGGTPASSFLTAGDYVITQPGWKAQFNHPFDMTSSGSTGEYTITNTPAGLSTVTARLPIDAPTAHGGKSWSIVSVRVCGKSIDNSMTPSLRTMNAAGAETKILELPDLTGAASTCADLTPPAPALVAPGSVYYVHLQLEMPASTNLTITPYTVRLRAS